MFKSKKSWVVTESFAKYRYLSFIADHEYDSLFLTQSYREQVGQLSNIVDAH